MEDLKNTRALPSYIALTLQSCIIFKFENGQRLYLYLRFNLLDQNVTLKPVDQVWAGQFLNCFDAG